MRLNIDRRFSKRALRVTPGALAACIVLASSIHHLSAVPRSASGRSEIVTSFPVGSQPEGIAMSPNGTLYVGNRLTRETTVVNQILMIDRVGTATVFAELPDSSPEAEGLLGLAVDPSGTLFAAFASFDANHGVWRISRDGLRVQRMAGSEAIAFPNAITFDSRGRLYVTDSFGGAIWRSVRTGGFDLWLADELLSPLADDPLGFPLPGANGIAFYRPDLVYVANTERGLIARVEILPGGRAGVPTPVTAPFAVPTVDGIAVDIHGHVHAALPGFALFGAAPLVRVDPSTGTVTPTVVDSVDLTRFDSPLSLIFGSGRWDVRTVLVTNGDLPVVPGGPGPGVVQVDVGVPGFPVP